VVEAMLEGGGGGHLEGGSQQGEGGRGRGESFPLNLGARALHHPRLVAEKVSVVVWFRFTRDQLQKAGCRVGMNQVRLLEEG